MKFNQKKFASDILQKRIDEDLSVIGAAEMCGVTRYTIMLLEKQGTFPNMGTLCLVCEWLGVNPDLYFE